MTGGPLGPGWGSETEAPPGEAHRARDDGVRPPPLGPRHHNLAVEVGGERELRDVAQRDEARDLVAERRVEARMEEPALAIERRDVDATDRDRSRNRRRARRGRCVNPNGPGDKRPVHVDLGAVRVQRGMRPYPSVDRSRAVPR